MGKTRDNRLAALFSKLANEFVLPHSLDSDEQGANLAVTHDDKVIHTAYSFDSSGDSYEFGAALGKVKPSDIPKISTDLLTSEPIRGITERITPDGKIIVLGSRDGLLSMSDAELQKLFLDDMARITNAYDQLKKTIEINK